MSIFAALRGAYSYEDAFGAKDCTSLAMRRAVREWFRLYYDTEGTEESDPCQRIAFTITRKLTATAFSEYTATSEDEFAQGVLAAMGGAKKKAMQLALVGGEAWLKPVPIMGGFTFSVVSRDNVLIFGRDGQGIPTDIGTAEYAAEGRSFYTLLERRTVDGRGYLTIRNRLYRSDMPDTLGVPVPLATLARYEALPEEYTFAERFNGLGLARLITPLENCVDGSMDGVSVYAPAVGLIHNVDRNEALLKNEFELTQARVIASYDMLKSDRGGRRLLKDKLFVAIDDGPETVGLTIFSPAIREQSFLARKQDYLRTAENIIGLKRGLLSEVEAVERTATEITSSKGEYAVTITDIQGMWTEAVKEAVVLCGKLGQLYHVPGAHEIDPEDIRISYGDGVLYDRDKVNQEMLAQFQMGLLAPERYLSWYYKLPCKTPEDRAKIRADYMADEQQLTSDVE